MQHGVFQSKVLEEEYLADDPPVVYRGEYPLVGVKKFSCPVPGCVEKAVSKWGLRHHLCERHPRDLLSLPGEGIYPKCVN